MSDLTVSDLGAVDGFKYVGQVASYAALQQEVPSYEGQHILLESYYDGWAATAQSPKGGGEFIALNSAADDDGGTIASVNSSWHWRRIIHNFLTVEMFGAVGDGATDDAAAIRNAYGVAAGLGINNLRGDNVYAVGSLIYLYSANQLGGQASGLNTVIGFNLYLNSVKVIASSWPALPAKWWDAQAVFQVAPADVEGLNLHVNYLDCAGVASGVSTVGGALNTSAVYIGNCKNFIIGFRNYIGQISQSGNECVLTGKDWSYGYVGVLHGGEGTASSNGECLDINISWMAGNRYGGVMLQDRSQYAAIMSGTYDYNGQWASQLVLTDASSTGDYDVSFGDVITNGTISTYALSSLMKNGVLDGGNPTLLVAESANKKDGTSDFTVGQTITCGSWSATISAIKLTSAVDGQIFYFDILVCNRTADFSKCKIFPTYVGGIIGHNLFTNWIIAPNSYDTAKASNLHGWGITGGAEVSQFYIEHIYGDTPVIEYFASGMSLHTSLALGDNALYGSSFSYTALQGGPAIIKTFSPAVSDSSPAYYDIFIGSVDPAQYVEAVVQVKTTSVSIVKSNVSNFTLTTSGLSLFAQILNANNVVTVTCKRKI